MANGLIFHDLKKKLTPAVVLYIGIYLRYQVRVYRTIVPLVFCFSLVLGHSVICKIYLV